MTVNIYVENGPNPATVVDDGNMVIRNWKEDGFEISTCTLPDGNWVYFNKEHLALGCGWVVIHGGIAIDQSDIGIEGASFIAADGIVPTYQNTKLVVRAIGDAAWLCVTSHKPENISIELMQITDQATVTFGSGVIFLDPDLSYGGSVVPQYEYICPGGTNTLEITGTGRVLLISNSNTGT